MKLFNQSTQLEIIDNGAQYTFWQFIEKWTHQLKDS